MNYKDFVRCEVENENNPKLTIAEASVASGFLSLSYFTKIFTEKEGASPSKWRKSNLLYPQNML